VVCDSGLIQAANASCTKAIAPEGEIIDAFLAELMIEYGIGVAEEHVYCVNKIDSEYFDEPQDITIFLYIWMGFF